MLHGGGVVGRMVERGKVVEKGRLKERRRVGKREGVRVEVERMVRVVRMLGLEGEDIRSRSKCLCSVFWRQVLCM